MAKKKTSAAASRKTSAKAAQKKATQKRAAGASSGAASERSTKKTAKKTQRSAATPKAAKKAAGSVRKVTKAPTSKPKAPKLVASDASAETPPRSTSKNPSGLTKKDIETFHELLLQKRAQIRGDVSTMRDEALRAGETGSLSNMPLHMADLGTDNFEQEFTLRLIEDERSLLREIDDALQRIEAGTYGVCLATGKPIGKARLRARPWAKYCYEYTLAQERGQGR